MKRAFNDKRAWLRIVEAFVAILLISAVLIFIFIRENPKEDASEKIYPLIDSILSEISLDDALRQQILDGQKSGVDSLIQSRLPDYLEYESRICELNEVCGISAHNNKEIYARSVVISATLETYSPKQLKLFVWFK